MKPESYAPYLHSFRKRALDVCCALFGIAIFSPALIAFAAAVKLSDRGSVLFRQKRLGRLRREIEVTKLRTMKDGKVTGPGRVLRKTGIDEMMQFFDVLALFRNHCGHAYLAHIIS